MTSSTGFETNAFFNIQQTLRWQSQFASINISLIPRSEYLDLMLNEFCALGCIVPTYVTV